MQELNSLHFRWYRKPIYKKDDFLHDSTLLAYMCNAFGAIPCLNIALGKNYNRVGPISRLDCLFGIHHMGSLGKIRHAEKSITFRVDPNYYLFL